MTKQDYLNLQELFAKEGNAVIQSISTTLTGKNYIDKSKLIASAYVLLNISAESELKDFDSFCDAIGIDDDRRAFLESCIGNAWQMVIGQKFRYNYDVLKSIILFCDDKEARFSGDMKTPVSISKLANSLFDFSEEDEVADFGIGSGSFAIETFLSNPSISVFGVDTNATAQAITSIRLELLGCKYVLEHGNIFDIDSDKRRFKNVFSNYPFGLRIREMGFERNRLLQKISLNTTAFSKSVSSDWLFNAAIVECLEEDGKGIAVMTNGSTWNGLDRKAREYFVDNGYLEAVIALPERVFDYTNISTTMVILSKNNKEVMLVDATQICEKGRRINTFSDSDIDKIVNAVKNETVNSKRVSKEDIADNDYVINPTRYLTEEIVVENGKPFEYFIKSITRGAPLRASELDEMISDEPTDYQYLMLSNIQKGLIDNNLPYIKGVDDNQKKYCLKNHSLILSKNGAPFKVAVAEIEENKTVLANGNLFVIDIDEKKADPYFIKIFLESEKGTALLKSISAGATIPNISVESLKKILVPNVPLAEQKKVVARYLAKMDEIALYQRKLKKAFEELGHIYDIEEK